MKVLIGLIVISAFIISIIFSNRSMEHFGGHGGAGHVGGVFHAGFRGGRRWRRGWWPWGGPYWQAGSNYISTICVDSTTGERVPCNPINWGL